MFMFVTKLENSLKSLEKAANYFVLENLGLISIQTLITYISVVKLVTHLTVLVVKLVYKHCSTVFSMYEAFVDFTIILARTFRVKL